MNKKKKCTKCRSMLPLSEYGKDGRNRDGHRSECKLCHCITQVKSLKRRIKTMKEQRK